ncbi:hypothetical protein AAFN88_13685 [Pelagibius sp. CAU 1746]|uniref:hypothetical protein n=1 Tax=Pelagibius sp. CAU 1746 TaxID=3140370 RepID=UPI00325B581B
MTNPKDDHWLARPETIRLLWKVFIVILLIAVALQFASGSDGHFGIDGWFGFGAAYGFLSCLAMVLVAKGLGFILKRPQDYYGGGGGDD